MKEKAVIIFIALALGLLITTGAFYFYQSTKGIAKKATDSVITKIARNERQTANTASKIKLQIISPANEAITDKRTVEIKGETNPGNIIILSSPLDDIITTSEDGKFSISIEIEANSNILTVRSIAPNGEEVCEKRILTYSTEEF